MEANAALRNVVPGGTRARVTGGCWSAWPRRALIETPTAEDLARLDRKRKGKKLSNQDWMLSRSDPEAKIAKMKDGTTHLAYKPEHAAWIWTRRRGGGGGAAPKPTRAIRTTLPKTLAAAEANLEAVDVAPTAEDPARMCGR